METQKLADQSNWKQIIKEKESKLEFFSQGTIKKPYQTGDTWEIPLFLKKLKTKWAKVLRQVYQHPMSFPGSLSPAMGELFRALIMNIAPKNVLEIGSYIGVSGLWIASGMVEHDSHHKLYCVDLFNPHRDNPWCPGVEMSDPKEFVKKNIKKCGFQNFIEVCTGIRRQLRPK